jgi:hypothetical protein
MGMSIVSWVALALATTSPALGNPVFTSASRSVAPMGATPSTTTALGAWTVETIHGSMCVPNPNNCPGMSAFGQSLCFSTSADQTSQVGPSGVTFAANLHADAELEYFYQNCSSSAGAGISATSSLTATFILDGPTSYTFTSSVTGGTDADHTQLNSSASGLYIFSTGVVSGVLPAGTYTLTISKHRSSSGPYLNGSYQESLVLVSPGLCCRGATCSTNVAQADCQPSGTAGAAFVGSSGPCNAADNATSPCCHADFNKNGTVSTQDIFDFLNAWFAGSPYANVGGDGVSGTLTSGNIFDFINAWFAGGC